MSQTYDFIKECGTFFVLTQNNDFPAGRPFGAIMEYNNFLYISTADTKEVYKQLSEHNKMQIIALKSGTRDWIRISGVATECFDQTIKQKMLEECPVLSKHYPSTNAPHFNLFRKRKILQRIVLPYK